MKIEKYKGGFSCEYADNPRIKKSIVDGEKRTITFQFVDGHILQHPFPEDYFDVYDHVYMSQYGIDISENGDLFFLHDWFSRGGLGCFETDTCEQRWRVKIKHARKACVDGEFIYCFFAEYGFTKISIQTGQIVKRYPFTNGDSCFFRIERGYYFMPLKRGYYSIINAEFEQIWRIPEFEITPYFKFIDSVELVGTMMTIIGWAQSVEERMLAGMHFQMLMEGKSEMSVDNRIHELAAAAGQSVEQYGFCHPSKRTMDVAKYEIK